MNQTLIFEEKRFSIPTGGNLPGGILERFSSRPSVYSHRLPPAVSGVPFRRVEELSSLVAPAALVEAVSGGGPPAVGGFSESLAWWLLWWFVGSWWFLSLGFYSHYRPLRRKLKRFR